MLSPLRTYFLIPCIALLLMLAKGVAQDIEAAAPQLHSILLPEQAFPELSDILRKAEENAPQILIRSELVTEAEGNKKSMASRKLPQLSGGYQVLAIIRKRDNEDNFSKAQYVPTGSLTLSQALYHWGSIDAEKRIGEIQHKLSKMDFNQAKAHLLKEIRRSYLEIYALNFNKQLAEEKLELAQKNLKDAEDKAAMKIVSAHQLDIARIQYNEAQFELAYISNNLENATSYFCDLTGGEKPNMGQSLPPQKLAQSILDKNPQLDPTDLSPRYYALEQELEIEKNNFIRIHSEQLPKLNFLTGVFEDNVDSTTSDSGVRRANVFAGLEVRWNIFDGFRTEGQRITSKAKQRRIKLELKQERQKTLRETSHIIRGLAIERDHIKIQMQKLALNENQLNAQQDLFDQGIIQYTDFLSSKSNRDAVEYQLANLIREYFNHVNEFLIYTSKI